MFVFVIDKFLQLFLYVFYLHLECRIRRYRISSKKKVKSLLKKWRESIEKLKSDRRMNRLWRRSKALIYKLRTIYYFKVNLEFSIITVIILLDYLVYS